MHGINLKGRKKRNIYPRITITVLIILALILFKATWNVFTKNIETKENLTETKEDLHDLEKRQDDLEKEIKSLNTERGIDREIRTKFRVTKEGEGMIMLIDSPLKSATTSSDENKSLWSRIRDLF
jgi:cell division protein FtsB